ncbi:MAG: hypothetical protein M1277_00300 [Patescibacteria group bacterium]|nr:hypothetical protein [Patescibacteria group bacterium]
MKKLIILPAIALLTLVGVNTIGQQGKTAHAQVLTPIVAQKSVQTPEKLDTKEATSEIKGVEVAGVSEVKGVEKDGPGGHQDSQGSNTDHQFNGAE